MFDKLVVSTDERRKTRTAKFFIGTVVTYLAAVTAALALSVAVSSPKLADTGGLSKVPVIPIVRGLPRVQPGQHPDQDGARRQDLSHFQRLDQIVENLGATPTPVGVTSNLPRLEGIGEVGTSREGGGTEPGVIGGIDGPGSLSERVEPPKPIPPKQIATENDKRPVPISSIVLQGKAIVRRTPPYPPLARSIRQAGTVSVEIVVSPEGRVETARAISGHPLLAQASVDAAYEWRFEPTLLNGHPVRVTGVITFVFKFD